MDKEIKQSKSPAWNSRSAVATVMGAAAAWTSYLRRGDSRAMERGSRVDLEEAARIDEALRTLREEELGLPELSVRDEISSG